MANSDSDSDDPGPSTTERPPVSFLGIAQYQNDPGGTAVESACTPTTTTTGSDPKDKRYLHGLIQSISQRFGGRPAATATRDNMSAGSGGQVMRQRLKNAVNLTKKNEHARIYHPQRKPKTSPVSGMELILYSPEQNGGYRRLGASDGIGALSKNQETDSNKLFSNALKVMRLMLRALGWIRRLACVLLVAYWGVVQPIFDHNSPLRRRYSEKATTCTDVAVIGMAYTGLFAALWLFLEIQPRVGSVFALVWSWVTEEDLDWC